MNKKNYKKIRDFFKLNGKKLSFGSFMKKCTMLVMILLSIDSFSQFKMEYLSRGLVAVDMKDHVFLSWRIFATDTGNIQYNIFRNGSLLTETPVVGLSNYSDSTGTSSDVYYVTTLRDNEVLDISTPTTVWKQNYLTIPLQTPSGYSPNDASVADLDGDGEFEIVLKMEGRTQDNANNGTTDPVFLHAYKFDGTLLWKINLGVNIRGGAHYTQFMVYDLNSDGIAEVACKTAPGTKDGTGSYLNLGPAANDDDSKDYRNTDGYILAGPEYLTVFDGLTGRELSTVNYIPARDKPFPLSTWGDTKGNRVDRFLATVAYFGSTPSLVMCRGYYDRTTLTAWDFKDGELVMRWKFDTEEDQANLKQYENQGAHCISVGDVDFDGKDEIMYGAMAFDDDGKPLYNTKFNHGDAAHLSDHIPGRPGLEFYMPSETAGKTHDGVTNPKVYIRDAATGEILIRKDGSGDIGRAMIADISAEHPGNEFWSSGDVNVYSSADGSSISTSKPPVNFAIWWDGDLLREMLDGTTISKWGSGNLLSASGCSSNNSTKSNPALSGDLLGDWREEVIWRTSDNKSLRLYTTTSPTQYGIYTLLHDHQYRLALTWQNVAYNQPPHPSFFIGHNMAAPPAQNIEIINPEDNPRISILNPQNGSELPLGHDLNVILHATGIPDTNEIVLYLNDLPVDTLISHPYNIAIKGLTTGTYTIKAQSTSKSGEIITSPSKSFSVDKGYPHIKLLTPANKSFIEYGNNLDITTEAFDTDGQVDSVVVFINGEKYTTIKTAPFSLTLTNPDMGSYEVSAIVYDDRGNATNSNTSSLIIGKSTTIEEALTGFCGFTNNEGTVDSNNAGFSGAGFANSSNKAGVQLNWALNNSTMNNYTLVYRFAGTTNRPGKILINGENFGSASFTSTGDWTIWNTELVELKNIPAGNIKVTLEATSNDGLPNIDYLKIISTNNNGIIEALACDSITSGSNYQSWVNSTFELFPVPASNEINVNLLASDELINEITIYSSNGAQVLRLNGVDNRKTLISTSHLYEGMYILKMQTNKGTYNKKFSISRKIKH